MSKKFVVALIGIGAAIGALVGMPFLEEGGTCGSPGCSIQSAVAPFVSAVLLGVVVSLLLGQRLTRANGGSASRSLGGWASQAGLLPRVDTGSGYEPAQREPARRPDSGDDGRASRRPQLGSRGRPTPQPRRQG